MSTSIRLLLFSTSACHLCEHAENLIGPLQDELGFTLVKVDISEDEALVERYGLRIPVIKREDKTEDLGWPFSQQEFLAYLA